MASTTLGGISWQVDADTSGAVNSIGQMSSQVNSAESSLSSLDAQTRTFQTRTARVNRIVSNYTATLRANGNQVSSNGIVLDRYGRINTTATNRISNLNRTMSSMTPVAAGVNRAVTGMGRNAGMAGIQFQQFIGQVQGGQSVMVALSQQSADLGFVLGAPLIGAILGISASLIGMLVPSLMESKNSMELLEKATENIKASLTLSINGVAEYAEEMKKLKVISEALVQVKLATLIAEQGEALKVAQKGIKDSVDDLRGAFDTYGDVVEKIYKEYSPKTVASMRELQSALRDVGLYASPESLEALEAALKNAGAAGINTTKVGRDLSNQLVTLISEYKTGKKTIDEIKKALEDSNIIMDESTDRIQKNADAVKSMVAALREQAKTINETNRQTALRIATEKNATAEQKKAINTSFDAIEANDKLKESQKELDKQMEILFNSEVTREKKRKAALEAESKKVVKESSTIADKRGDPVALLKEQKDEELAVLEAAEEAGLKLHTDYTTLRKNIDDQYAEAEQVAREKKFAAESEYNALTLSAIDAMGVASQNMIMGLINGTMSAKDAMLQLANTIVSEAVGALVQVGVQYAKNAVIAQVTDQSILAAKQATAATAAAMHTAAVTAAVTELAALGAAGAMAATAAIPIVGPAAAPAAGAAMSGLITATGSVAIAAAPVAGMREHGGSVLGGQTYEMGEKNKPELLVIPGNNGKVLSNSEMKGLSGGGGAQLNQTINNYASQDGYQVQTRGDGITAPQVIDIIRSEMGNANSYSRRSLGSTSNVSNKARSRR